MRILEIVTVPFFAPRGTSFSSLQRTQALSRLGHQVEVLAYPLGDDVAVDGVRVHRTPPLPGVRSIPMGPSLAKAVLDAFLAVKTAWWLFLRGPWDLVHVHEEAAIWMAFLRPFHRRPVLYDMHSSLVEQLSNFGYSESGWLRRAMAWCERRALAAADGVIVICPELDERLEAQAVPAPRAMIENLPVTWDLPQPTAEEVAALGRELGVEGCRTVVYTGSFGKNQGLEESIEAIGEVRRSHPEARLVLVGGGGDDLDRVRRFATERGLADGVVFAGSRPHQQMPAVMALAEILLSPRTAGTNTPLKIYSYLAAGRPIVATDLYTHTQVLDAETALLVEPTPGGLAGGIAALLDDPQQARRLAAAARHLAAERYGVERYTERVREIVELTAGRRRGSR